MSPTDIDLSGQAAFVADMGADIAIIEAKPERCEQMTALIEDRGSRALCIPGGYRQDRLLIPVQ